MYEIINQRLKRKRTRTFHWGTHQARHQRWGNRTRKVPSRLQVHRVRELSGPGGTGMGAREARQRAWAAWHSGGYWHEKVTNPGVGQSDGERRDAGMHPCTRRVCTPLSGWLSAVIPKHPSCSVHMTHPLPPSWSPAHPPRPPAPGTALVTASGQLSRVSQSLQHKVPLLACPPLGQDAQARRPGDPAWSPLSLNCQATFSAHHRTVPPPRR